MEVFDVEYTVAALGVALYVIACKEKPTPLAC